MKWMGSDIEYDQP